MPKETETPTKTTSLGWFGVDDDGARQLDSDIGGGAPIPREENGQTSRLPKKGMGGVGKSGMTPPIRV